MAKHSRALPSGRQRKVFLQLFGLIACCTGAVSTFAQEVEFRPSLEVVLSYSDNVFLAPEGLERSDYVGQINPGFRLIDDQGVFTTATDYRLQTVIFADGSDFNSVFHQLNSQSTLEFVPERFGLNIDAAADQIMVDPQRSIPTSNVAATDNLGDVYMGNVNPYLTQRLGGSGTYARLDYNYGIGVYDGFELDTFSRVDDYDQTLGRFFIGRDEAEGEWQWSLTYDYQLVDYDVVEEYRYERAGAAFGVPVGANVRLIATGGSETDLLQGRSVGGVDSEFWEVGFRLRGGQRSLLEIRAGERFFGDSIYGRFQFDGRRVNISLSYSEDPTTSALDGLDGLALASREDVPEELLDSGEILDEVFVSQIRPDLYLSKLFRGRIDLEGKRSSVYLSYVDETREIIDSASTLEGQQEGQQQIIAGLIYELGAKTNLEIAAQHSEGTYVETVASTDILLTTISLTRRLSRTLDARFSLRRAKQKTDSVSQFGNYTENGADIALEYSF